MGLSVGVVSIDYLDEPQPPVSDFLKEIATDKGFQMDAWGGGWGENAFLEFEQPILKERAIEWAAVRQLELDEQFLLMAWISRLPWRDGYVILHPGQ